jgi:RHS repeat-associated protein
MHQTYTFSPTQNNGRIVRMNDFVAQQEVNYLYDELNRLKEAKTTDPTQWGQSFTYDGFGNRTAETVIQGTAPSLNLAYDPATNRIISYGYQYDANGNLEKLPPHLITTTAMEYDIENRLIKATNNSGQTDEYRYDPANKRIWKKKPLGQTWEEETYFYGVNGEKLGTYVGTTSFGVRHTNLYFGGKLIRAEGQVAVLDRLGSVSNGKKYFPYGEEQGQTSAQDRTKFATYFRDATTALDYADQRYYSRSIGRFLTPDPSEGGIDPQSPQTWNRYSYVVSDPVNHFDPMGLCAVSYSTANSGFGYWLCTQYRAEYREPPNPANYWTDNGPAGGYGGVCNTNPPPAFMPAGSADPPANTPCGPPPPPPPSSEPECFAQLKYRPVNNLGANVFGATHAFWWVQDRTGAHYIISAGPKGYQDSDSTYLEAWVVSGDYNGQDNKDKTVAWSSGLSSAFCNSIDLMLAAARGFPRRSLYYEPVVGPNSNSAARYFGVRGGFTPTAPPGSYGWDYPILLP